MPEKWDPVVYRERAKAWREKAASLPEADPNRTARLALAEGYQRLADQLEAVRLKAKATRTRGHVCLRFSRERLSDRAVFILLAISVAALGLWWTCYLWLSWAGLSRG